MSDYFCDFCGVKLTYNVKHHCVKDTLDELAIEIREMREAIAEHTRTLNNMIESIPAEVWESTWEYDDDE